MAEQTKITDRQSTECITIVAGEHKDIILTDVLDTRLCFKQETGSSLSLFLFHLNNQNFHADIEIEQLGENCKTEIRGLAILRCNQQSECNTHVYHRVGKGTSRQTMKYIAADQAKASFTGHLYIAQDAQQTDAQQTNRNLLLSNQAKISTKPQLEIYADNVKASHGATTGQIDLSSLFYMQQRGLSETQAKQLLIMAFAEEITNGITNEKKLEQITQLITERLNLINL